MQLPSLFGLDFIAGPADVTQAYAASYDVGLVVGSILIAVFAAFCALEMTEQGERHRRWVGLGALMLGIGVWAMHFIGMTAFRIDCGVRYEPFLTAFSMVPGIFAAYVALSTISRQNPGPARLLFAGTVMGAGIGLMHYTGMAAIRMNGVLRYDPALFLLSIVAAVVLANLALGVRIFLAKLRIDHLPYVNSLVGGAIMGVAISSMHYIAMSAAYFIPAGSEPALEYNSPVVLATVVGIGTLLILFAGFIFFIISARMLLAQQRSEDALSLLQNVRAVLDHMGDGLLVTDTAGTVTQANPALLALFSVGQEVEGRSCQAVFGDEIARFIGEALSEGGERGSLSREVAIPENRIARVVATLLHVGSELRGAVITFRDITHEVEVSRMKTDFIANVSHELRTPLTSVLGFAKVIRKQFQKTIVPAIDFSQPKLQDTVAKVQSHLDIIVAEGERLSHLINDVLDLTKIEAGKTEWQAEPLLMPTLVERAINATAALHQQKGLAVTLEADPDLPAVTGDPDRLLQVVINLLSNAAKFTDQGEIRCTLRCRDGELVVAVTDQGCGISPRDQQLLFERFRQVGDVMTDKPTGTGLGLAICKQIIEHHRGRIWVESKPGQGSTFAFSLPVDPVAGEHGRRAEHRPPANDAPLAGRTILIVDDDPNIRELLREELVAAGYSVCEAENGAHAIREATARRPDLILLDVMMPGMNGFEVASRLRAQPETQETPIIILSIVDERAKGLAAGADRYLFKPIESDVLLAEIAGLLRRQRSSKQALLVRESGATVEAMRELLQAKGYQVEVFDQSTPGLERIRDLLPHCFAVAATAPENPHHVISAMDTAQAGERVLLVVNHEPREASTPETDHA